MNIIWFPARETHIRVPEEGTLMSFYIDEADLKNWKFFQDISKQLRDLGFRLIMISMKGLAFPKLKYAREELLGKKEIRTFVKMIKKMKEKAKGT